MDGKKYQRHLFQGYLLVLMLIFSSLGETVAQDVVTENTVTESAGPESTVSVISTETETIGASKHSSATAAMPTMSTSSYTSGYSGSNMSFSCQSFVCTGQQCYQGKELYVNTTFSMCPSMSYCEMFSHNSSYYEARCAVHCMHHRCRQNETMMNGTSMNGCSIYCCNTSKCLTLENVMSNDMMKNNTTPPMSTVTVPTTITTTTTTTTIVYSDKTCRSFTCDGLDCYKSNTGAAVKKCQVGINHCELQKKVSGSAVSYEGGCSNTCATSTKSCATITNANCFQECCNATNTGCCMKLDGQVHFNEASRVNLNSVLKIFSYAFIVIFSSRFFTSVRA
ncbi:Hypothetical predicted protein [Pelobates cultripes]|nr:Hypothetical predicted protein [Pelobates cultripes]